MKVLTCNSARATVLVLLLACYAMSLFAAEQPKYYITSDQALSIVQQLSGETDLSVEYLQGLDDIFPDSGLFVVRSRTTHQEWSVLAYGGQLLCYRDLAKQKEDIGAENGSDEQLRQLAISLAIKVRHDVSSFDKYESFVDRKFHEISLVFRTDDHVYDPENCVAVKFDSHSGSPLKINFDKDFGKVNYPRFAGHISRDDGIQLIIAKLKRDRHVNWVHVDASLSDCRNRMIQYPIYRTDALGLGKFVYEYQISYSTDNRIDSWEIYQKMLKDGSHPFGVKIVDLAVDTKTGSISLVPGDWTADLFPFDSVIKVKIDNRTTSLFDPPFRKGKTVYFNIRYLENARLWGGKISQEGDKVTLRVNGNMLTLHTNGDVSLNKKFIKSPTALFVIKHDAYYVDIKLLKTIFANDSSWSFKDNTLYIYTVLPPKGKDTFKKAR